MPLVVGLFLFMKVGLLLKHRQAKQTKEKFLSNYSIRI